MRDYQSIREEWIHIRKIPSTNKHEVDFIKQAVLGLIVNKTSNMLKDAGKGNHDDYVAQAVKSEYKQTIDALSQGVDCQIQVDILEALMPKTLSAEETSGTIIAIIARYDNPNMGLVMKELKAIEGLDMKMASKMVKELI